MKRLKAKLIDFLLVFSIILIPLGSYIFAIKAIGIAYETELGMIYYLPIVMMILITFYVYFGLLAKKNNGSIGKKFMNLKITGVKQNSLKYFIREPLVHVFLLAVIYTTIFNHFIICFLIMSLIYLLALYLKVDLWNKIFKNEVVEQ